MCDQDDLGHMQNSLSMGWHWLGLRKRHRSPPPIAETLSLIRERRRVDLECVGESYTRSVRVHASGRKLGKYRNA